MTKLVFFGDNDTTSDAEAVNAAMLKENADQYVFVGDGPYAKSGTKWVDMMKKSFPTTDKLMMSQGNHDNNESESDQTEKDIEAWIPSLGTTKWLEGKQVGNSYIISMNTQDMDVEFPRDQFNWVTAELVKAKGLRSAGTIDWVIMLFHKPFFTEKSSHSPYTAVRFQYKEIFRDAQVDFCVSGHNHNTQLWKPMIPNASQANGEGEELFTQLPDGTYDFSKDHGAAFIVSGHAGHEWNPIKEQNPHVMYHKDSGKFGYTLIEINGKKATVFAKDTDNAITFEYKVTREGGTIPDPDPQPCPAGQHRDSNGNCVPDIPPTTDPEPTCPPGYKFNKATCKCIKEDGTGPHPCPKNYHWDESLQKCIPDLMPPFERCAHGSHWDYNQSKCVPDTGPQTCPAGEHWDSAQNKCVPDIIVDPGTGEIDPNGLKWLVGKGKQTVIAQSRDEATDDRWSGNVTGLRNGFEATMIAKGTGLSGDAHFAMKQFGGNHSGSAASKQRWYDIGLRQNGDIQLQWEGPHPSNHDFTLPDTKQFIKKISKNLEGNWVGLKWCVQTMKPDGSPADGGIRVRMWVDEDPVDASGKPKNNWALVCDFIDGIDVNVIEPQDYKAPDEQDMEVRRSDTDNHEVFQGGLHVRVL